MNEHDTEVMRGLLENEGFVPCHHYADADLLIVNTCAVRQKAEDKATAFLGEMRRWKKERPGRLLALGGCMPQQGGDVLNYLGKSFDHIDIIFGTHSLPYLPALIQEAQISPQPVIDIEDRGNSSREGLPITRSSRFHAWVPIIYGCTNFCSYCIVPFVRGPERSRPLSNIMEEVEGLARQGYQEITLLGQNVNAYGKDINGKSEFALLMEKLSEIDEIKRIRFLTSHPYDFTLNIVEVMARSPKICEHIHLPLQSGSNRILEMMNRGYTAEHYKDLAHNIRKLLPQASLTTDLIVGFPGETEEDFWQTMEMVEEIRFDAAYTFVYSDRKGTPAARMPSKVSSETKKERISHLIKRQQEIGLEINRELIGKSVEVLVEGVSKSDPEKLTGRTGTNKLVHFPGERVKEGHFCRVKILKAKTWHLAGELDEASVSTINNGGGRQSVE